MLNDSVSPARIHRMTKKYQYQVPKQCFKKVQDIGVRSDTSGTREMARAFSSAERYGALVLRGVSGNSKKPYTATGSVMMPSMMKLATKSACIVHQYLLHDQLTAISSPIVPEDHSLTGGSQTG